MNNKIDKHICFVCDRSWSLFTNGDTTGIGGVETRSVRLAEMMAKNYKKVTFAIKKTENKIVKTRGLNIVEYEPASISNAPNLGLVKIDADIYVVFESNHITADAVRTCNILGKPVVYWATSINDFNKNYKLDNYQEYDWGFIGRECAYCFYMADYIICQTKDQQKILMENHGLESIVIKNPIKIPKKLKIESKENKNILWIGRSESFNKRPLLLFEMAKQLPDFNFFMILNNIDNTFFNDLIKIKPINVNIAEYVPPENMDEIFTKSSIFISTSSKKYEGFPNVFLHAMSAGIPVVSLEADPDGIFQKEGCGIVCFGKIDIARDAILNLLEDNKKKDIIIKKAFSYIKKNHSMKIINEQMIELFNNISLAKNKSIFWSDFSYNREFEQIEKKHISLLNNPCIRFLNKIRNIIGKAELQ